MDTKLDNTGVKTFFTLGGGGRHYACNSINCIMVGGYVYISVHFHPPVNTKVNNNQRVPKILGGHTCPQWPPISYTYADTYIHT